MKTYKILFKDTYIELATVKANDVDHALYRLAKELGYKNYTDMVEHEQFTRQDLYFFSGID